LLFLGGCWALPAIAWADVSVSVRSGYYFDDTGNELSDRFVADGVTPQASVLGLGVYYAFPPDSAAEDWSVAVGGLWGRGNEHYRDIDIIRQDDEIVLQRALNGTLSFITGYRYEYTGVRSHEDGRTVVAPGVPVGSLVTSTESQRRHSVRAGFALDVTTARNEADSSQHIVASLAAVAAMGKNSVSYQIDNGGPEPESVEITQSHIWRGGPELTAGYRWNFSDSTALELKYRGAFLFDRLATDAHVNAVHGVSLSIGYRFHTE
jgi:hypothetical protein